MATRTTYAGLFGVTLSTLMFQTLITRIFSVTMWYHFAFMAVSIAMFGMTVGALVVYLRPRCFAPEDAHLRLTQASLAFAVLIVVGFLCHIYAPWVTGVGSLGAVQAGRRAGDAALSGEWLSTVAYLGVTYTTIALPFVASGIAVCVALTRFPRQLNRLYAVDLIGAAVGCLAFIVVLRSTDGPTAILVVAALAAWSGLAFAQAPALERRRRNAAALAVVLSVAAVGHHVLASRGHAVLRLTFTKGRATDVPLYEKWNEYAYFRVYPGGDVPTAWGYSTDYAPAYRVEQKNVLLDALAGTVITRTDGRHFEHLDHLRSDVTSIVHFLRPDSDVLVVGVGGGRDVLTALAFDQRSATGVEINGDLIRSLTEEFGEFSGHLDRHEKVTLVTDEARSFITRTDRRFDIIQVSLIDTWAATSAGAFVLSENSLYTVEAWRTFLARLRPGGALSFSRWHTPDHPAEMLRTVSLAAGALRASGITDPAHHLIAVSNLGGPRPPKFERRNPWLGVVTVLASPTPFARADVARLRKLAHHFNYGVLLAPGLPADEALTRIVGAPDLEALAAEFPFDISPPTDDKPFFFNMLRLSDVFAGTAVEGQVNAFNLRAVTTLGSLLAVVGGLTLACIIVPLALTQRREWLRGSAPHFLFFAAIGLGFMLVEISQLQRLVLFLGHPSYSLSTVLFSLLLASGIGSALTPPPDARGLPSALPLVGLLVALALFGALTPAATSAFAGATNPVRVAVAVATLVPIGIPMGMAFPTGMGLAELRAQPLKPWLWGINGATSVLASVLGVAIALGAGIGASFWTGVACYAVALGAHGLARRG